LGIGSAFTRAGPLSVLLGYTFTGVAIFAMMQCLGEMATWLPLPGSIPQFCARYVDDALGFAVGWNVGLLSLSFVFGFHFPLSQAILLDECTVHSPNSS
jgi:amino acid permease